MNIAAQPQGAQLPLDGFELPDFPIQAQSLMALTLVSVRNRVNEESQSMSLNTGTETDTATLPVRIPTSFPRGIQSLTIEAFTSGFATGFLAGLAAYLADLKSLVLYQCRLGVGGGEGEAKFFAAPGLRALHLLDVNFGDGGAVVAGIAKGVTARTERALMFLEVGYTEEHRGQDPTGTLAAARDASLAAALPALICPSLITVKFNVQLPDDDVVAPQSEGNPTTSLAQSKRAAAPPTAITPFPALSCTDIVTALTSDATRPRPLKALNLTLYTLTLSSLHAVLSQHPRLLILNVTLESPNPNDNDGDGSPSTRVADWKAALVSAVSQCKELEQLEIVASFETPSSSSSSSSSLAPAGDAKPLSRNAKATALSVLPAASELKALSEKCEKLNEVKGSVLRCMSDGFVEWERRGGQWIGGIKGI